jgi:hypothetical protein
MQNFLMLKQAVRMLTTVIYRVKRKASLWVNGLI